MRALDKGTSFVVTRNGIAVGELVPLRPRRFVQAETAQAAFAKAPRVVYKRVRRDLDALVRQDAKPRG